MVYSLKIRKKAGLPARPERLDHRAASNRRLGDSGSLFGLCVGDRRTVLRFRGDLLSHRGTRDLHDHHGYSGDEVKTENRCPSSSGARDDGHLEQCPP